MNRTIVRLALVALLGLPVVALAGLLLGAALAALFGAAGLRDVIVLAVGGAASSLAAGRLLSARSRPLLPAIGVQGAHAVWLLVTVFAHAQWGGLVDVLAIAAPLAWLSARPGRRPLAVLLGAHAVQAVLLFVQWLSARDPGLLLPLLVSHLALRAAGVLLTLRGLETIARRDVRRTTSTPPPLRSAPG